MSDSTLLPPAALPVNPSSAPVVAVGAVVWNEKREIVLIRRGKPPRKGDWSIPGGRVEWGETLRDAIIREVREETGLIFEIAAPIETVDSVTRDETGNVVRHYVLVDFVGRTAGGTLQAASDAEDARWVSISRLNEYALWNETRRIIEKSADILALSGA